MTFLCVNKICSVVKREGGRRQSRGGLFNQTDSKLYVYVVVNLGMKYNILTMLS